MADPNQLTEYLPSPNYSDNLLVSSDRSILSSKYVEVIPREASTFGYQSAPNVVSSQTLNNRTTYSISDPRHYIDWSETYFHQFFQTNCASAAGNALRAFLDNGGIHAFIKTVYIRHGSTELHRVENYNKLYNIKNLSLNGREYRNMMLADSADSYEDQDFDNPNDYAVNSITFVPAQAEYTVVGQVLTLATAAAGGDAYEELIVGDLIRIETAVLNYTARVLTIDAANLLTVEGLPAVAISPGDILSIIKIGRGARNTEQATRRYVVDSAAASTVQPKHKVTFQLDLGLFKIEQYFPLPFLNQNLEINIEWVEPHLGFVVPFGAGNTTNLLGYAITKPRMVAKMVEPSADVFESHKALWREDGLVYRTENVRSYQNQLTTGNQFNVSYQTNIKSLKSILSVLTDQSDANSSQNSAAAQQHYSQSTFNKKDMNSFRFRVGGMAFPDYGPVDVDSLGNAEAWRMLQAALRMPGHRESSIDPWQWRSATGNKFIMGMSFSKDMSYNTGIDASSNYVEHEIVLGTTIDADPQTMHSFLEFDQVLIISEKHGARVFY